MAIHVLLLTLLRQQCRWSKAELGRRAGLHPSQISLFESQRLKPYEGQLRRMADALGFQGDPSKLLEEVDNDIR